MEIPTRSSVTSNFNKTCVTEVIKYTVLMYVSVLNSQREVIETFNTTKMQLTNTVKTRLKKEKHHAYNICITIVGWNS